MHDDEENEKTVEKAFSSYVKSCLRHASRDYFRKILRRSSNTISLDEKSLDSLNPNINIHIHSSTQIENQTVLLQIIKELNFTLLNFVRFHDRNSS